MSSFWFSIWMKFSFWYEISFRYHKLKMNSVLRWNCKASGACVSFSRWWTKRLFSRWLSRLILSCERSMNFILERNLFQNETHCVVPENIHTAPMEGFCFAPPRPPGNSSLASYCPSNSLAFKSPLPLGISNDLPWGEYGYFLEPHILVSCEQPLKHKTTTTKNKQTKKNGQCLPHGNKPVCEKWAILSKV